MNKRGFFTMLITVIVLLIVGFFWFVGQMNGGDLDEGLVNESDAGEGKCVKVRTSCCPCNMGGTEKCVLASEAEEYEENLSECSEGLICAAVYNCEIESCEYIEGDCVAV